MTEKQTDASAGSHPHDHPQSFWLWVMCLTGVDYFSTLGYQPSIAFEATGLLAPLATVILVCVTLFGALPVYRYVVRESFEGQGSIAMLERIVHGWTGKFLVLILLGFAATDFVITKTLSAADAAEHLIHNPVWKTTPAWLHSQVLVTMFLLVLLGAMFLRGFREAIWVSVVIVSIYMTLNAVVIGGSVIYLLSHPTLLQTWFDNVTSGHWHLEHVPLRGTDWFTIIAICLLFFPKLALGLSGFETGAAVMTLVRGDETDTRQRPLGRIRNTRRLLLTAALIMSVYLLGSSLVTCTLIPPAQLRGGAAANRALAYLAHGSSDHLICPLFGNVFGTIYDASTVLILWFAGASAMSGLLNLVPRYLPRYGMAPEWAAAIRPLVLLFTGVNLFVTWVFQASVEAQGGAYATGVMVLISSGCMAVVIDRWKKSGDRSWWFRMPWGYAVILVIFLYTTGAIMIEKPEGLMISTCFILAVIGTSMFSRYRRSTEARVTHFEFATPESRFLWDSIRHYELPVLVPHRPGGQSLVKKEEIIRARHRLAPDVPIVFIEATVEDSSEFYHSPRMEVRQEEGRFVIKVTRSASIAHVIATIGLEMSRTGKPPEIHFGWSNESPVVANIGFILFGEGNVPWLVREIIRKAEPNEERQPAVVIG